MMRRILAILMMLALLMNGVPGAVSEEMEAALEESLIPEVTLEEFADVEVPSVEEVPEAAAYAEAEVLPEITPEPVPEAGEPAPEPVPGLMPEETAAPEEAAELRVRIEEESRQGEEMPLVELRARVSGEGEWGYRWEYRDDAAWEAALAADAAADEASFWQEISGADEETLEISARFGAAYAAYSYRCIVTDGEREAVSEAYKPETAEEALPETEEDAAGEATEELPEDLPAVDNEASSEEPAEETLAEANEEAAEEQPAEQTETLEDEAEPAELPAAPASLAAAAIRLGVGEKYVIFPDGAGECSYASENAKIAAVSKDGVITAKKTGETKITVSLGGQVIECMVTVIKAPSRVTLSASKLSMGAGQTAALTAELNNGNESAVEFSSSKKSVATVDENGVITAHAKGSAKITAKAYNGKKASCTVTVVAAPAEIRLNTESLTLPAGMGAQLKAGVNKGAAADYSYASSDESVAEVDAGGNVTAQKPGSAVITVRTYNGLTAECVVTVTEAPTEIYLNVGKLSLGVKETRQLRPANDMGCDGGYSYKSAEPKVATVSEDGVVTAKKAGITYISVTSYNGLSTGCEITVGKAPSRVTLPAKSMTMGEGQVETLAASLNSGSMGSISFSSSRESVASVDENGVVTAVGAGKATITAKAYNGKKASCTVTVVAAPESLELAKSSASLPAGVKLDLEPAVNKGSYANYSCSSSDESVAVVDQNGVVTAVAVGSAIITVTTYNGLSAECEISVTPAPMKLEINAEEITLGLKEKFRLEAVSDFGSDAGITYKSNKASVASVDAKGVVTAKKTGTAIITASTFNGVTAECIVTVKKAPSSIKFAEKELMLFAGQREPLQVILSSGSAGAVTFTSDSECALVDDKGYVTAVSAGEAKITAETYNGKKAAMTITILPAENNISALKIVYEQKEVNGQKQQLTFAEATVSTLDACTLYVEVLTEDEREVLKTYSAGADASLTADAVRAEITEALPAYFVLRASLQDEEGQKLCKEFITRRYTRAYQDSENQKPSDFPEDKVLDFGDAGYGVLQDNVVRVNADVRESNGCYTYAANEVPAPGTVLLLDNTPVKVKTAADNGDGTITVVQDTNVYLADIYKVFKVDTDVNLGAASGARAKPETGEGGLEFFRIKETLPFGPVSATADVGIGLNVKVFYDEKFGKDYFEYECSVVAEGTLDASVTAKWELKDGKETPEILLYNNDSIPIGATGLFATLKVSVPVEFNVYGKGTAGVSFYAKTGYAYNSKDGSREIKEKDGDSYIMLEGGFDLKTGPKVELGISMAKILTASVSGWAGLEIEGVAKGLRYEASAATAKEVHACDLCVDMEASVFAEFEGKLGYKITEKLKDDLLSIKLLSGKWVWGKSFFSVENEPESIYGGEMTWKTGECRNKKYRIDFYTVDLDEKKVNVPVTISGRNTKTVTKTSPDFVQLYNGDYSAAAAFDSGTSTENFRVYNEPMTLKIKEEGVEIEGYVSDEETDKPIKGARVVLTEAGGKMFTATTDASGHFEFEKQPAGTYSFEFTAKGYQMAGLLNQVYEAGDKQTILISLKAGQTPKIHAMLNDVGSKRAVTENGVMPGTVPEVTLKYTKSKWGDATVSVYHEDCAKPFVYKGGMYTLEANIYGVDMGDGDYTFVLTVYNYMRFNGSGEQVYFLKVSNGKFQTLKTFDSMTCADGIRLSEGTFSSGSKVNGTIEPTGRKFTLTTNDSKSARKGKALWYGSHYGEFILEEREDGFYNLIFKTQECGVDADDKIGGVCTRYVMEDGQLVLESQWFEANNGKVTYR